MILTVTLNAAIDKRYVVDDFKVGEVNRVRECTYDPGGKVPKWLPQVLWAATQAIILKMP